MKNITSKLYVAIKGLMKEEGQDLVEYALVVALIVFAATAGMKSLATNINTVFANLGTTLTSTT